MPADRVIHVGPNFRVAVDDHRGRPVRGLVIRVESGAAVEKEITDENGVVLFRDLSPGLYSLKAEQDAGGWSAKVLEVHSDRSGSTVPMTWPSVTPLRIRSLKGILHVPNYVPGQAGPKLDLALLSGASGQRLTSVRTSDTGQFDFEVTAPGIYFLSLEPSSLKGWDGSPVTGRIAVSVETDAPSDHLDLELGWTDCGLSYVDLTPCPPAELRIGQLRGRVIGPADAVVVRGGDVLRRAPVRMDSGGPAIPGAEILLVDPSGNLVERLRTDSSGEFALEQTLAGPYELLVRSGQFETFRARVFSAPDTPPPAKLSIHLDHGGRCSSARLQ
jgi:hypothetical protein